MKSENDVTIVNGEDNKSTQEEVINLAVVACGDRVHETLTLLKSALMFTQPFLHFFIVTENHLKKDFIQQVKKNL